MHLCVCLCMEESEGYGGGWLKGEGGRRGNQNWLVAFDKVLEEFGSGVIGS